MHRVMLLNPKGGSGKTTIATGLASYFAASGWPTLIFDYDAQGSSSRWLRVRPGHRPPVEGVAAYETRAGVTRSWQMRIPPGTERVVIDTPAWIRTPELLDLVRRTDSIIVPVLPSYIDIDAVGVFLDRLRGLEPIRSGDVRVALVANRVRARTVVSKELDEFLSGLGFAHIATLRESQSYVRAAATGLGVHELRTARARYDWCQWQSLLAWLGSLRQPELPLDRPVMRPAVAAG